MDTEVRSTSMERSFAVGDWLVEPSINRISTASEDIYLRPQLMEVLVYLADLQGRVATLESIHDDLWTGKVVSSGTIYNCIAELRQAFSKSGKKINYIETLPKKGYRLAPPIVAMPTSPGNHRTDNSIAIMPLVNRSGDADIEYLCAGISDEILYGLSKFKSLNVFSAASLKDQDLDVRVVGLRFDAKMILSGSLQKFGQKLRLGFRLDKVSNGETIWSDRYDQEMKDIFELQDTVARHVIGALTPALKSSYASEPMLDIAGTRNPDALNAFLLGKYALSRTTVESYDDAIACFEQAVTIDPTFARAHYRLYLSSYMKRRHFGAGQDALDKARTAAEDARKHGFQPAVPWVHIQRRLYRDTRLNYQELGLEAIEKLRDKDPEWGSFGYEQLTWVLSACGLFRATLDFAKRMLDSPAHNFEDSDADEEIPHYYAALGLYEEAIRQWSSIIQKDPARPLFRFERSVLYARTGQFDYAQNDLDVLVDGHHAYLARAFYHFWRDEKDRIPEYHERLLALRYVQPSYLLWTYAMIGDIESGVDQYERAVESASRSYIDFGNVRAMSRGKLPMSIVDDLEQHSGVQALLKKEGINEAWRTELIQRLNEIVDITGIHVQPDDQYR